MKNVSLVFVLLMLVSCARKKVVTQQLIENPFDNTANDARLADLEGRVAALENAVTLNIAQITLNASNIGLLQTQVDSEHDRLTQAIIDLQAEIVTSSSVVLAQLVTERDQLQDQLDQLDINLMNLENNVAGYVVQGTAAYNALLSQIQALQTSNGLLNGNVNTLLTQMTVIQSQENVVEIVDPCPTNNTTNYKEYFFRTSSGKLVAFFENGSQRFLSVLVPGNYQTTDSRHCTFSLDVNNQIH